MKIKCPFCRTDYAADIPGGKRAECALCGHAWMPPRHRGPILIWGAVLFAAVFAGMAAVRYMPTKKPKAPLVIEMTGVQKTAEEAWVVSGRVRNLSGKIYGIPDMALVVKNNAGDEVLRQKVRPPVPILDIGEAAEFAHTIADFPPAAKKLAVEFIK
ncbi:MAG: zinc-ribbon domain-containing protein [Alphaproteobacteria bacterium]|nr:zinc-ribbon domain-containing protein [Alphaproteobacteria bacterium]